MSDADPDAAAVADRHAATGIAAGVGAATVPAVPPGLRVREMGPADWPAVAAIYGEGIATGNATFETDVPAWEHWDAGHLPGHRLVAELDDHVVGWTAVSPVSTRCAYAGVVEHSVYVAGSARGRRVGRRLLAALIDSTERAGIWTIQTGIFPENTASLALHRAAGFRVLGVRERPGQLGGRWRDVVVLERRSPVTGR
jgi:L-amino acid N-acyltransferase YncA